MRVLSLFDGMACGLVALKRAGIKVEKYYASEIDKYAIQVAMKNHPEIIQIGDVTKIDFTEYIGKVDLIIGGSPCQGFSFAGKQLNFNDPRSKLFFKFVEAIEVIKPRYFLLENVKMKKEYQDVISNYLEVEPIEINSSLLSAQNRKRLYWTNIQNISQPEDKGIFLKDVLESGEVDRNKSYCIDANYYKGGSLKNYIEKSRRQLVLSRSEERLQVKAPTISTCQGGHREPKVSTDNITWRILTPIECERLQTLPDNYTEGVSNTQRYKMLGNGWTVDVIAHIFSFLPK